MSFSLNYCLLLCLFHFYFYVYIFFFAFGPTRPKCPKLRPNAPLKPNSPICLSPLDQTYLPWLWPSRTQTANSLLAQLASMPIDPNSLCLHPLPTQHLVSLLLPHLSRPPITKSPLSPHSAMATLPPPRLQHSPTTRQQTGSTCLPTWPPFPLPPKREKTL